MGSLTEMVEAQREADSRYPEQHEAEFLIAQAVKDRLDSRILPGQPLEEIEEVIGADENRVQPQRPNIWVIDGETRLSEGTSTNDTLEMDIALQVDVSSGATSPLEGHRKARMLTGIAGRELMRNDQRGRDHRLGGLAFVNDIWFLRSQKGPPLSKGIQTHSATYRVRFKASR